MNEDYFQNKTKNDSISIDVLLIDDTVKTLNINSYDNVEEILNKFCSENNITNKEIQSNLKKVIWEEKKKKIQLEEDKIKNKTFFKKDQQDKNNQKGKISIREFEKNQSLKKGKNIIILKKQNNKRSQSPYTERKTHLFSNDNNKERYNGNNIGDKLYRDFLEKEMERMEKKKELFLKEQNKEDKDLINSKINENSRKITNDLIKNSYNQKEKKSSSDKKLKEEKEREKEEQNLFKPQLSKITNYLGYIKRKNREEKLQNEYIEINPEYLVQERTLTPKPSMKFLNSDVKSNKSDILNKSDDNIIKYKTIYRPSHPINREINGKKIPIPKIDPTNNLHDYLYIEARMLKEKRENERKRILNEECPFIPTISKSTDKYIKKESRKTNIFNRLYTERISRSPQRPTVGNTAKKIFISKDNNKSNYLNKISLPNNLKRTKSPQGRLTTNIQLEDKNNLKIYKNEKNFPIERNYKKLFNILDNDKDGFISSSKINLSVFTMKELKCYAKILGYIQERSCPIDINEFCLVMSIYYGQ